MQLPAGRTRLCSAQGQGRVGGLSLLTALLIYSLINVTAAMRRPKIIYPTNTTIISREGEALSVPCTAETTYQRFHNVYWLVNGTFVEDVYPDGRVTEKTAGPKPSNQRNFTVTQTLEFRTLQPEDFRNTFTCVVQDPSGGDQKRLRFKLLDDKRVKITFRKHRDPERQQ
ncbi:interleukin-18-binding protein [Dendropsophus ebraccatus]|uniref:interleukin-18-binding protein n=1 Tax=Dendropsophus ebraccatus TaxID=150705 RepID=UPI0038320ABB